MEQINQQEVQIDKQENINKLVIASRGSKLAMVQSQQIKSLLEQQQNNIEISIKEVSSKGDQDLNSPLYQMSSVGVFSKRVERELLEGRAEVGVHSLKDLPTTMAPTLTIGAIPQMANRADCVIFNSHYKQQQLSSLAQLPPGSIVGSSSLRRIHCLTHHYPHLAFQDIRGNLQTRLDKLQQGPYACIVLAQAGLHRLQLDHLVDFCLDPSVFGYAPGQGALAVQCLANNSPVVSLLQQIHHPPTTYIVNQERLFLNTLEGGCKLPLAVYSYYLNNTFVLRGMLWDQKGNQLSQEEQAHSPQDQQVGLRLAHKMLANGADVVLQNIKQAL